MDTSVATENRQPTGVMPVLFGGDAQQGVAGSFGFSVKNQASLPTPRPLGDVRYAWPSDSECFWESGKGARQLRVNEDTGVG